jgi:DNA-binding response OmpR family regulator
VKHVLENHSFAKALTVNNVTIDWRSMVVRDADGVEERLTFKDYRVLKLLVDSAPRPVSRDEILDKVWGEDQYPSPRSVDNTIVRLRQALRDENGELIRSVRGLGYQWESH